MTRVIPNPQFNDAAFPPSQGFDLNDMGAYGGPGAALWPAISSAMPVVLVNGQPAAPFQQFIFPVSAPPVITFTNGYAGGFFEYTLNGSNPLDYPTYTDIPLVLTNSAQIRLVAYSQDFIPYTIAAPVTVNVLPGYSLAAGTAGGGGVIPSSGLYLSNTVVTLTATNAPGWTFLNWAGDAAGTNNPISIVINGAKNVQAVFGTPLTVAAAGNGTVQTNPVLALYPYGSTIQLMGVPNSGSSYFRLWGGAAAGNSFSPLNFVVTNANPNITALFGGLPAGNCDTQPAGQWSGNSQSKPAGHLLPNRLRRDGYRNSGQRCPLRGLERLGYGHQQSIDAHAQHESDGHRQFRLHQSSGRPTAEHHHHQSGERNNFRRPVAHPGLCQGQRPEPRRAGHPSGVLREWQPNRGDDQRAVQFLPGPTPQWEQML